MALQLEFVLMVQMRKENVKLNMNVNLVYKKIGCIVARRPKNSKMIILRFQF